MASIVTLDPVASALETILTHFKTQIPALVVKRGIQELGNDQLGSGPEISLVEISREWEELSPTVVNEVPLNAIISTVTWKVAQLRIVAQMDAFMSYRVAHDVIGPALDSAFYNRLPWKGGLELLSNWYHDRPLTISKAGAGINQRDPGEVAQGSWERRWELEILTDLVVVGQSPTIQEIAIALSTQLGPDTVTDPDLLIN